MFRKQLRLAMVGFGAHSRRTVIPAILSVPELTLDSIVVREKSRSVAASPEFAHLFADDYHAVIRRKDVDFVYVSTPTGSHSSIAKTALLAGKHVVCEKPISVRYEETVDLVNLASSLGLVLMEVDAYQRHRQFLWLANDLSRRISGGARVVSCRSNFAIPHRDISDFRYSSALGGGALLDLGFYPLSAMLSLFGRPGSIHANAYIDQGLGVDLSGAALLAYDGFSAYVSWALGSVYDSSIDVCGTDFAISVRRAFAKPRDFDSGVEVVEQIDGETKRISIHIGSDDQFAKFLSDAMECICSTDGLQRQAEYKKALDRSLVVDQVMKQSNARRI